MTQNEKITKAVELLSRAGKTKKVILFGSCARNEAGKESDVDFLVLEDPLEDRIGEALLDEILDSDRISDEIVGFHCQHAGAECDK